MGLAAAVPALTGAADVFGIGSSISSMKGGQQAAGQDTSALNSLFGTESGAINQLLSSYFGPGGADAALKALTGFAQGNLGKPYSDPYTTAAQGDATALANYNGLKPAQIAGLQSSMQQSGLQTINSLRSSMGGVANPQAVIQQALMGNAQQGANMGLQLGSQGAAEQLQGLQSAGGLETSLSGLNQNWQQMMLNSILGGAGIQSNTLGEALGGLSGMAGTYGNMASTAAGNSQLGAGGIMSGLTGLAGIPGIGGTNTMKGSSTPQGAISALPNPTPTQPVPYGSGMKGGPGGM